MFDSNVKSALLVGLATSVVAYAGFQYYSGDIEMKDVNKKSLFENLGKSNLCKLILGDNSSKEVVNSNERATTPHHL